jgi:hypothetical protein
VRAHQVLALIEKAVFARWLPMGTLAPGAADADRWLAAAAARARE